MSTQAPTTCPVVRSHHADSPSQWYLFGEDLACGLIGPFDSVEAAQDHYRFQAERGDAAVFEGSCKVVQWDSLDKIPNGEWAMEHNLATPEEDRAMTA